jgi:NADH-quinone oxidoreductase subunit L
MFPLYIGCAPDVLHLAGYVGAFTALFAAVIACTQTDIKRVLAFSTISQIGFMMVALGVCTSDDPHGGGLGYMASLFHLFTHAFFKALLFLCAGAVIHAVHSNEMKDMGGLRKFLPVTHATFLVACLAIAGIPPFSGFFSKDEILAACFRFSPAMGVLMSGIAMLTAFYMFRLYFRIFWNKTYGAGHHTPHEAPRTMTVPLVILAVLTCVAGWIPFGQFVSSSGEAYAIHLNAAVAIVSVCAAVAAIGLATLIYGKANGRPVTHFRSLYRAAYRRFYIDEIYRFVTHRIIFACISTPLAWFDRHVIDGFMNGLARATHTASVRIRGLQSGNVQQYAMVFLSGALILIMILLLARSGSTQTHLESTQIESGSTPVSPANCCKERMNGIFYFPSTGILPDPDTRSPAGVVYTPRQEWHTLPGRSDTHSPAGVTYTPRQEWHSPDRPVATHSPVRMRHTPPYRCATLTRPVATTSNLIPHTSYIIHITHQ